MPNVTTVGFDVSLTSTGVAIWRHRKLVTTGLIKTRSKQHDHLQRYKYILDRIVRVIELFDPDLVCIEDYAFSQHSSSDAVLKELGGTIRMKLFEMEQPFVLVGIGQLKKYATGNGSPKTKKDAVVEAVAERWGHRFRTFDETDAFILAQVARVLAAQGGLDWSLTRKQKEVIRTIIKKNNVRGNLDLQKWKLREPDDDDF